MNPAKKPSDARSIHGKSYDRGYTAGMKNEQDKTKKKVEMFEQIIDSQKYTDTDFCVWLKCQLRNVFGNKIGDEK